MTNISRTFRLSSVLYNSKHAQQCWLFDVHLKEGFLYCLYIYCVYLYIYTCVCVCVCVCVYLYCVIVYSYSNITVGG